MKTVVLFGGTFDPPHIGHLLIAQLTLEQAGADAVWFLPAPVPPHKPAEVPLNYPLRVKMVQALIKDQPQFTLCTIEESLPKPSYTVDTVLACKKRFSDHRFLFLIGADSLAQLPTWHRAQELTAEVPFVVAVRAGHEFLTMLNDIRASLPDLRAEELIMPMVDVSSSWIRERRAVGKPLCGIVPEAVLAVWLSSVEHP